MRNARRTVHSSNLVRAETTGEAGRAQSSAVFCRVAVVVEKGRGEGRGKGRR